MKIKGDPWVFPWVKNEMKFFFYEFGDRWHQSHEKNDWDYATPKSPILVGFRLSLSHSIRDDVLDFRFIHCETIGNTILKKLWLGFIRMLAEAIRQTSKSPSARIILIPLHIVGNIWYILHFRRINFCIPISGMKRASSS